MSAKFTCGRRADPFSFGHGTENEDTWRADGTCSYCGSVSPAAFFAAVEAGHEVGPTDKNYKAYIDVPDPLAGTDRVVSAITFDLAPERVEAEGWIKVGWRQRRWLRRDGWGASGDGYKWLQLTKRGETKHAKFYFQHLDEASRARFIELFNAGTMNLGSPGHFYRLPYFVRACTDPTCEQA